MEFFAERLRLNCLKPGEHVCFLARRDTRFLTARSITADRQTELSCWAVTDEPVEYGARVLRIGETVQVKNPPVQVLPIAETDYILGLWVIERAMGARQ